MQRIKIDKHNFAVIISEIVGTKIICKQVMSLYYYNFHIIPSTVLYQEWKWWCISAAFGWQSQANPVYKCIQIVFSFPKNCQIMIIYLLVEKTNSFRKYYSSICISKPHIHSRFIELSLTDWEINNLR